MRFSALVLAVLLSPIVFGVYSATQLEFYKVGVTPNMGVAVTQVKPNEAFSVKTIVTSDRYDIITPTLFLPAECSFTPPFSSLLAGGKYMGNPKEVGEGQTDFYFSGLQCQQEFLFDSDYKNIRFGLTSFWQSLNLQGVIKLVPTGTPIQAPAPPEAINPIVNFYFVTASGTKAGILLVEAGKPFTLQAETTGGKAAGLKIVGDGCTAYRTFYSPTLAKWAVTCPREGAYSLQAQYYSDGSDYRSAPVAVKVSKRNTPSILCELVGLGC